MLTESLQGFWVTLRSRRVTCATHLNCDDTLTLTALLDIYVSRCNVDTYVSKDIHSHLISQNESRAGLLTVFSGAEHSRLLWNTGEYWKNRKGKQTFVVVLIPSSTVCFVNGTKNVITSIWRKDSVKGQRAELVCFHTPIESNSIPPEWDGFHPEWMGSYTVLPAELWAQAFIQQVHPVIPIHTPLDADTWGLNLGVFGSRVSTLPSELQPPR